MLPCRKVMDPPQPRERSRLLDRALELARASHEGDRARGVTDVEHPLTVARLLAEHGFSDEVVAAGLLHEVVEDSTTDLDEVGERFGAEVRELVAAMTENPTIRSYPRRKAEHRARVSGHPRAAAIYAADKLAKLRDVNSTDQIPDRQLEHYRETLRTLSRRYPGLPFLAELREELARRQGRKLVGPRDD